MIGQYVKRLRVPYCSDSYPPGSLGIHVVWGKGVLLSLFITCSVIRLSGVNGFGFFVVCVLIVMYSVIGTISESVVCVGQVCRVFRYVCVFE